MSRTNKHQQSNSRSRAKAKTKIKNTQQQRSITPISMLLATISAIIGSGWLFSSYYASTLAGPAALVSWLIGGVGVIIISFTFAEICTLIPITGSSTRIPQITHGTLTCFTFSWIIWLSWMALAPTEVQAVMQYSNYFFANLTSTSGKLTSTGIIFAIILMLILSSINFYSLRWLVRCNNILTLWKFFIPLIIAIIILSKHHSLHNSLQFGFAPMHIHGILAALSTGGIVFAFNGFKQAAEMAGEAQNPSKAIPFAIIGSVIACLVLFLLLQLAFLTSLTPGNLIHGWKHLTLYQNNSPLFSILKQNDLSSLNITLAITAVIAPLAAGLMYVSSASRSLLAISQNKHLPSILQKTSINGNPTVAIGVNFIIGICLFFPLPGWDKMVAFLTSLMTLSYASAPIALMTLRSQLPNKHRPFSLPFYLIWSYTALVLCTLFAYWSGWQTLSKLDIFIAIGLITLIIYQTYSKKYNISNNTSNNTSNTKWNIKESTWLWVYLIGLVLISYCGNYGGHDLLSEKSINIIICLFCMLVMFLAYKFRLDNLQTATYLKEMESQS